MGQDIYQKLTEPSTKNNPPFSRTDFPSENFHTPLPGGGAKSPSSEPSFIPDQ